MSDTIEKSVVTDLLEVQSWLEGWGDYTNRSSGGGNLGYQSPMANMIYNNVQQNHGSRPILFNMDDEAYYTLIERELGRLRSPGVKDQDLTAVQRRHRMWASLIKRYYVYRESYTRLSKSVVSKYEHGEGTVKRSHVRKVQEYLSDAERHIYEAILELA